MEQSVDSRQFAVDKGIGRMKEIGNHQNYGLSGSEVFLHLICDLRENFRAVDSKTLK
jgi:hypothetical protein